jgi:plasmid stabilization system protein ParE
VKYRIVTQPGARADAREAFRFILEQWPAEAACWSAGLEKFLAKIGEEPERYPVAIEESELLGVTIRQALYWERWGVYRILFAVEGETISVLFIRRSGRGPIES